MRMLRAILGVCVCMVGCVVVLTTLTATPPTTTTAFHTLVTKTHQEGINQLNNLKAELQGEPPLDEKLLKHLGFVDPPTLYPHHAWHNLSMPAIVTAVSSKQLDDIMDIVQVSLQISSNSSLVVFALSLSQTEFHQLENECNISCTVIEFDFTPYPSHVRDLHLHAYRSIIIQKMLMWAGSVLWLDPSIRLITSDAPSLERWTEQALSVGGILTWPLEYPTSHLPTSALTHPDMFTAFHSHKHLYDFHQMADAGTVLIYNFDKVHSQLMKFWVTCALTLSCISPVGAQSSGCKYNKKPLFRYSGCHLFDTSAFNVALGLTFGHDSHPYLAATIQFISTAMMQSQFPSSQTSHHQPIPVSSAVAHHSKRKSSEDSKLLESEENSSIQHLETSEDASVDRMPMSNFNTLHRNSHLSFAQRFLHSDVESKQ